MRIGLVSASPSPWDSPWQMRQQLLTRLPGHFEVVWMEPPHTRHQLLQRRGPTFRQPDPDRWPGLHLYTPQPWLPRLHRPRWLGNATAKHRLRTARRYLEARGCDLIHLYLWRPEPELMEVAKGFDRITYHIHDEYSFSPDDPPTSREELRVLRSADLVVIHSPTMLWKKGGENPNTLFLPNGVDFALYDKDWAEPQELKEVPRPRIGYTGYMKNQLDWELILKLVAGHPEAYFVFVGPIHDHQGIQESIGKLKALPNTLFPGTRPPEDLPAWVQQFDVCIMPYRHDGYTRYIYPLKLHEYLASGRPVVGTWLPTLEPFRQWISLVKEEDEWRKALAEALSPLENTPERIRARKQVALAHDWNSLAARLGRALEASMPARIDEGSATTRGGTPQDLDAGKAKPPLRLRLGSGFETGGSSGR